MIFGFWCLLVVVCLLVVGLWVIGGRCWFCDFVCGGLGWFRFFAWLGECVCLRLLGYSGECVRGACYLLDCLNG